jgi:hypothetical protein
MNPRQSKGLGSVGAARGRRARPNRSAPRAIGTLMRKIQCQESPVTRIPPMMGAVAGAMTLTLVITLAMCTCCSYG